MKEIPLDYSQIYIQENIRLTQEYMDYIADYKHGLSITTFSIPGTMAIILTPIFFFCFYESIDHKVRTFLYLLIGIFTVLYILYRWAYSCDLKLWEKDIKNGKNKLTSIVLYRNDDDEYSLTFAAWNKKETNIRLIVTKEEYLRYSVGTKVVVTYLKYRKDVLSIHEL